MQAPISLSDEAGRPDSDGRGPTSGATTALELLQALERINEFLIGRPDDVEALLGKAALLQRLDRPLLALTTADRVLAISPDHLDALFLRGSLLFGMGFEAGADDVWRKIVSAPAVSANDWAIRGAAWSNLRRYDDALVDLDRALALDPRHVGASYARAYTLAYASRSQEARAAYQKTIELAPWHAVARWAKPFASVPPLQPEAEELPVLRQALMEDLEELESWVGDAGPNTDWHAVGIVQPFNLAYQAVNNVEACRRFGSLCSRTMARWLQMQVLRRPSSPGRGRIRIGLVGSHMHQHSVWHAITRGWIAELDPSRFELHVFHLGGSRDAETRWTRERVAAFQQGSGTLGDWVQRIGDSACEVLMYPEIGMHHLTLQLASLRLAPLQVTSWGHPETSGLPSIDAYLSAADFEPPGADAHYTEELVRLPGLGCCYLRPIVGTGPLPEALPERRSGDVWLVCPGSPFKYTPAYDKVLVDIARKLGRCRFLFFRHESGATPHLEQRIRASFAAAGLTPDDFLRFLPWLGKGSFRALMAEADVYLDTIGFSGFNTALHAVEAGLPIVTVEGDFMRGRFAAAILRRLGLDDWVAADTDGYRERVLRLARDAGLREQVRQQMAERKDRLYGDTVSIRALENWLLARCRP